MSETNDTSYLQLGTFAAIMAAAGLTQKGGWRLGVRPVVDRTVLKAEPVAIGEFTIEGGTAATVTVFENLGTSVEVDLRAMQEKYGKENDPGVAPEEVARRNLEFSTRIVRGPGSARADVEIERVPGNEGAGGRVIESVFGEELTAGLEASGASASVALEALDVEMPEPGVPDEPWKKSLYSMRIEIGFLERQKMEAAGNG